MPVRTKPTRRRASLSSRSLFHSDPMPNLYRVADTVLHSLQVLALRLVDQAVRRLGDDAVGDREPPLEDDAGRAVVAILAVNMAFVGRPDRRSCRRNAKRRSSRAPPGAPWASAAPMPPSHATSVRSAVRAGGGSARCTRLAPASPGGTDAQNPGFGSVVTPLASGTSIRWRGQSCRARTPRIAGAAPPPCRHNKRASSGEAEAACWLCLASKSSVRKGLDSTLSWHI